MLLKELRKEVNQELEAFKLRKLIKHRDLVLRKENFTQISDYQKYVTPDNPIVKSYLISMGLLSTIELYSLNQ